MVGGLQEGTVPEGERIIERGAFRARPGQQRLLLAAQRRRHPARFVRVLTARTFHQPCEVAQIECPGRSSSSLDIPQKGMATT